MMDGLVLFLEKEGLVWYNLKKKPPKKILLSVKFLMLQVEKKHN